MTGIGMVFSAFNTMIERIRIAYQEYNRSEEDLKQFPGSMRAKQQHAVAQVVFSEEAAGAVRMFSERSVEGIRAMRRQNKNRRVDEPSMGELNILSALRMIPHPSDEFLDAVANTIKGNRLALMAMDAIVRAAWADEPDHVCKTYSDMLKPVMSIAEADEAITKLQKFCEKLEKKSPEELAAHNTFANSNDLIVSVLNVDPESFAQAVSGVDGM